MTVLTLALKYEKMRKVEEYAKKEERTNEELVDDAIDFYLHEKFIDELNAHGKKWGITPKVIAEEISRDFDETTGEAVVTGAECRRP